MESDVKRENVGSERMLKLLSQNENLIFLLHKENLR